MGDGRARSEKVMLPESVMQEPAQLRSWIARAMAHAATLPPKGGQKAKKAKKAATKQR